MRDHEWTCGICGSKVVNKGDYELDYACKAEEALRLLSLWWTARTTRDPVQIERASLALHEIAGRLKVSRHRLWDD